MQIHLGGGGSSKNDHELRFLGNIELFERSLTCSYWACWGEVCDTTLFL